MESLHKYQTFGEHVLLPSTYISEKGIQGRKLDTRPALFTVIADSANVEMYLVNKEVLEFFTKLQRVCRCDIMGRQKHTRRSV